MNTSQDPTFTRAPRPVTAADLSLIACLGCDLVVRGPDPASTGIALCPRCGARLHSRKVRSIERTWALLIAATILYLPANLLPIMTTIYTGYERSDTILTGVIHLALEGLWPLAALVFFASVVVPILKIISLSYLLFSIQRHSRRQVFERTRIYRLIEGIGRWSMLDIYVIALLVALVKLGAIASVEAESGALFFGALVVVTMLAAKSFDPRLIWDRSV